MRENRVKSIWQAGGAVINGWLSIPSPFAAERVGHTGFDSVTVDQQHGMIGYDAALPMWQALSATEATPLTRVPWNDPIPIMKALDAGAYGIICPMINTAEEAAQFVGACYYPPHEPGYRSFGPPRGMLYGGPDYFENANDTILTFAMIETAEAVENLDAICATPGLDAVYIGPSDLAISLGFKPAAYPNEDVVIDAIMKIRDVAEKHDVKPCIHCASGKMAAEYIEMGFRFCTISSEANLMALKCQEEIAAARG